jgi:hypothetical protein
MARDIAGYDMALAITQAALNTQFQRAFPNGAGLPPWNATLDDEDGASVWNVVFGTPGVDLNTPLARGAAIVLPIASGAYTYRQVKLVGGKPATVRVTQDLAGTTIRVTAPLISGQDTPRWSDGCARRRIFMDLTDPNLDTTFSIGLRGQALVNLTALFQTYLNQLQQRNNATFLFGSVNVPSGPAKAGPLAPRACDFTVNSQAANPNNNTLNILLLVDSAQLPDGSGAGLLPNNLAPPGSDALFLLSDYQLLKKFVLPGIIAGLQKSDAGSAFSLDWFGFTRNPARASLTGKVGYQGGWFSKFDVYIAHGEVALDIEYRKEKRVIFDAVTGIGVVSAYLSVYANAGRLAARPSWTQSQVRWHGSSVVWRVFQDIFTRGFAEIRERVGAEAVASAEQAAGGAGDRDCQRAATHRTARAGWPGLHCRVAAGPPGRRRGAGRARPGLGGRDSSHHAAGAVRARTAVRRSGGRACGLSSKPFRMARGRRLPPIAYAVSREVADGDRHGQGGVHAAAAEAFQVERDVGVADGLEMLGDRLACRRFDQPGQAVERHFDPGDGAVMAHAQLFQAELAQETLALPDLVQHAGVNRRAVGDARRKAGHRRLIPVRHAEAPGGLANLGLRQSRLLQRGAHAALPRRDRAGPVVASVVHVRAVDDCGDVLARGDLLQFVEERRLAEVAAVRGIRGVVRIGQFVGVRGKDGNVQFLGDRQCGAHLVGGDALGGRQHADRALAQRIVRDFEQEGAVNAARIGDDDAAKFTQNRAQPRQFLLQCRRHVASLPCLRAAPLAISAAIAPAPMPLSILTTASPGAQLCNIESSAATPPPPAP